MCTGHLRAHAAGFVHRDFKPENVLYGKDGVARVNDFGVARILRQPERADAAESMAEQATVTRTGGVVGTPGYIAPEILRHEPVDERADQFSFCVAVYAALYGERPFEALEGPSRIAETLGRLRPPRTGIVPRWLQRIISRGLAADRRDRWPTIDALTAAIERGLGRRRRALVLIAIAVMVHVLAASVMAIVMRAMPAPPTPPLPNTITYELAADRAGLAARLGAGGKLVSFRFKRGTRSPAPELEAADLAFAAATAQRGVDGWVAAFDPKGGMIRNARRFEYAAIAEEIDTHAEDRVPEGWLAARIRFSTRRGRRRGYHPAQGHVAPASTGARPSGTTRGAAISASERGRRSCPCRRTPASDIVHWTRSGPPESPRPPAPVGG